MKKLLIIISVFILSGVLAACSREGLAGENEDTTILEATVIEHDGGLLVTPVAGSSELLSADRISVSFRKSNNNDDKTAKEEDDNGRYKPGDLLRITYDGLIAESYPAQIWASKIELIGRNLLIDAYLEIIDDIYHEDIGLNADISMMALDTSQWTGLMPVEKEIVLKSLEDRYELEIIEASYDEIVEMGLIDDERHYFTEGILIEIEDIEYKEASDTLSAKIKKWRSGDGAIGWDVEAEYKDDEWEILRKNTWIS